MTALQRPPDAYIGNGYVVDDDIAGLVHIPRSAHTLAGFREWVLSEEFPEKLRVTFLRGEVYLDMSKEAIRTHAAVKTPVAVTLGNLNDEIDFGDLYINGVLVTNKAAQVSNNPDMVAVFWETLESGRVRYVAKKEHEMEIEGSPDWLLEIISDSSVFKDTQQLRTAYHEAGVREYWLIDARGDEIIFQILHWRKNGYVAAPNKDGWLRSRVFGRDFRLTRKRDRRGAWKYDLHVRTI
jgi:Uma2 family endonuclease